jgi:hypothetical protein
VTGGSGFFGETATVSALNGVEGTQLMRTIHLKLPLFKGPPAAAYLQAEHADLVDIKDFPNVTAALERFQTRPAVAKGLSIHLCLKRVVRP